MSEVEVHWPDDTIELMLEGESRHPLMLLRALPPMEANEAVQPSSAFLAALHTFGLATPSLQAAVRQAADAGKGLMVGFPPEVVTGLRSGALHLMHSSDGYLPTAVNSASRVVAQARVVGAVGVGGVVGGAAAGATASALAVGHF